MSDPSNQNSNATTNQPADWRGTLSVEEKAFVENKKWENPQQVLDSYIKLEKYTGADPAFHLILPKENKPELWDPIYKRLGRPDKPDGYQLPDGLKDDEVIQKFVKEVAYQAGLSQNQAQQIFSWYSKSEEDAEKAFMADAEINAQKAIGELKAEWGSAYDERTEIARRAAKSVFTKEELEGLEGVIGTKRLMETMYALGKPMAEHGFISGELSSGGSIGMSKEAAKVRIEQLKQDPAFAAKIAANDSESLVEWQKLQRIAYS